MFNVSVYCICIRVLIRLGWLLLCHKQIKSTQLLIPYKNLEHTMIPVGYLKAINDLQALQLYIL